MTDGGKTMGKDTIVSINGLNFEFVCDKYQARGRLKANKIIVVINANLKDITNGAKSKATQVAFMNTKASLKQPF